MLPHSFTGLGVIGQRQGSAEGVGEACRITAWKDLAHTDDEIVRRADPVRNDRENTSGHRLVDNEAPFLHLTRQHNDIGSMIVSRQFRLIDETSDRPATGPQAGPDFVRQYAIADEHHVHVVCQCFHCRTQVQWTLARTQLPAEQDDRFVTVQVPPGKEFRTRGRQRTRESFVVHRIRRPDDP